MSEQTALALLQLEPALGWASIACWCLAAHRGPQLSIPTG